jgi:hypothetical protein
MRGCQAAAVCHTDSRQPNDRAARRRCLEQNAVTDFDDLKERNTIFAATDFRAELKINPSTMVIGCVDPRVDPTHMLALGQLAYYIFFGGAAVLGASEAIRSMLKGDAFWFLFGAAPFLGGTYMVAEAVRGARLRQRVRPMRSSASQCALIGGSW